MANYFVTNPIDVVKVGQRVKVKVLEIDLEREKVSLTMKDGDVSVKPTKIISEKKEIQKDDEIGESTMKGNINFS